VKKLIYILVILSVFGLADFEIKGDGSPADLTKIGISARFWGMGRSGVALSDDSGALLLNPAAMAMARSFEMSGMSTQVLGVTNYSLVNAVIPLWDQNQTFGFSYINENAGAIYSSEQRDQNGHPIRGGLIQNSNTIVSLGFASKIYIPDLIDDLYLGTMFKGYSRVLGNMSSSSMAADFGALYKWKPNISLGVTLRNALQSGIRYSLSPANEVDYYDTDLVFGAAFALMNNDLTVAIDQHTNPKFGRTYLGVEYWLGKAVALRSGLADNDVTLGIGVRYDMLQVDVGLRYQDAPLDNQMFFSLTWGNARRIFLDRPGIEIVENDNRRQTQQIEQIQPVSQFDIPEDVRIL